MSGFHFLLCELVAGGENDIVWVLNSSLGDDTVDAALFRLLHSPPKIFSCTHSLSNNWGF